MLRIDETLSPGQGCLLLTIVTNLLEAHHVEKSPAEIEALIRQGSVWMDNRRIKDPRKALGDVPHSIRIFVPDLPVGHFTLDPELVSYEDDDLLIVYKPPNVNTCPSPYSDEDCLSHGVSTYLSRSGTGYDVQTINRLDRATQGLVFFAKNKHTERHLHRMFRDRLVHKRYLALTPLSDGTTDRGSGRHANMTADREEAGQVRLSRALIVDRPVEWRGKKQDARSHIYSLGTVRMTEFMGSPRLRLYAVIPHTGRPHQIRQHFAAELLPIWGDHVYGTYPGDSILGLACVMYRFRHPVSGAAIRVHRLPEFYAPRS